MRIIASPKFMKAKKKAIPLLQIELDKAVREIVADPSIGKAKSGDLSGVRVHKFKGGNQRYLLAYIADEEELSLFAWGVHENFYRDLK